MAFKTFAPGVLTSSDVNTFLMQQAVITCTSSTRPSSPVEGMTIYETDTDRYKTYSGSAWEDGFKTGAWQTYSATFINVSTGTDWVQGNATINAAYQKVGRLVAVRFSIVMGSTTTFGTKWLGVSLPFSNSIGSEDLGAGVAWAKDVSTGNTYACKIGVLSNYASISADNHSTGIFVLFDAIDSTTPMTWQSGDRLEGQFIYEAAS